MSTDQRSHVFGFAPLGRGPRVVRFEQAVYGSFAFQERGYAVLARSPGCRPDWLAEFRSACQNLGERPTGAAEAGGLFALKLPSGCWAIVGICALGADDRGRPGALAFHGLFLTPRAYRKAGCDPFALAGALRTDWSAETRTLPTGVWTVEPTRTLADDPRAAQIASALARGRRVAVEAPGPIDALARGVWARLSPRVRGRASVATWTFGNANRFDLLAVPRLAGVALDASYLDLLETDANPEARPSVSWRLPRMRIALWSLAATAGVGLSLTIRERMNAGPSVAAPAPIAPAAANPGPPMPEDREPFDPDARRDLSEALTGLAERFGVEIAAVPGADPSALMAQIARSLRYRGPFLSDSDRARLVRDPDRDAALALRWDAQARRFADDRRLPDGFRTGPLRWQVVALAWTFHSESDAEGDPSAPRRSPAEVAQALAEALAVADPLRPTPLAARYPVLTSYLAFLGRLPRR